MADTQYVMPKPEGYLDLACFGVSCGANVAICRDNEWVCEDVPADKKVLIDDGTCPVSLDFNRHDIRPVCPEDVDPKCGCNPCSSDGDGGTVEPPEPGEGITIEQANQNLVDNLEQVAASKGGG